MDAYKASILIVSYNHEKFIAQALQSACDQETDFPVEILVADDCSMDGTLAVVRRFQQTYPGKIKILESATNLGITRNYERGLAACSGQYIAVLEGDDYWLSSDRLRTMVDFLGSRPECAFAFNRIRLEIAGESRLHQWDSKQPYALRTGDDLAEENFIGNFSACVYRAELVRRLEPSLYQQKMYDWLFNLAVARFGKIGYVPQVLSVYRLHQSGAYSGMRSEQRVLETLALIPVYNSFLGSRYAEAFAFHTRLLDLRLKSLRLRAKWERHKRSPFMTGYVVVAKGLLIMNESLLRLVNALRKTRLKGER